jgi:hypothetical protein
MHDIKSFELAQIGARRKRCGSAIDATVANNSAAKSRVNRVIVCLLAFVISVRSHTSGQA